MLAEGAPQNARAFEFIGYRELRTHLETCESLSNTVEAIAQATRRYAKRQLTWFRREFGVQWFAAFGDAPETLSAALDYLEPLLTQSQK